MPKRIAGVVTWHSPSPRTFKRLGGPSSIMHYMTLHVCVEAKHYKYFKPGTKVRLEVL